MRENKGVEHNNIERTYGKKWILLKPALISIRPLGMICVVLGLIAMLGYAFQIESLYRPIPGGPATNPLTALCVIMLGAGLSINHLIVNSTKQQLFASIVILFSMFRLIDAVSGSELALTVTPFQNLVQQELDEGKNNAMGVNTALMLLCLSVAFILNIFYKVFLSQLLSFLVLSLPVFAFIGYVYGGDLLYGHMSLMTVLFGFLLGAGILFLRAHRGITRALLSPYIAGRIARMQVVIGFLVPFVTGWWISTLDMSGGRALGWLVICMIAFIFGITCFSAFKQEQVDHKRRLAERALSRRALYDALTQLPNRHMFYDVAKHELARCNRSNQLAWILMVDVDYFKKVNDIAGHLVGDKVLVHVGETLLKSVRATDTVARLGGEEFVLLLVDTSINGVRRVAETVRKNIATMVVPEWTTSHGAITVSIGCAETKTHQTLTATLSAADRALYQAKQQGRNRVVIERLCEQNQLTSQKTVNALNPDLEILS